MKTINILIAKLYMNLKYGIKKPSKSHLFSAQMGISLMINLWVYLIINVSTLNRSNNIKASSFYILYCIVLYFLHRYAWQLNQVEEFINDKENEKKLNTAIWIFWGLTMMPLLIRRVIVYGL